MWQKQRQWTPTQLDFHFLVTLTSFAARLCGIKMCTCLSQFPCLNVYAFLQWWWWVIELWEVCMCLDHLAFELLNCKICSLKISDMVQLLTTLISPCLSEEGTLLSKHLSVWPRNILWAAQKCGALSTVSKRALGPYSSMSIRTLYHSLTASHEKRFTLQCYVTAIRKKLHSVCDPDTIFAYGCIAIYVT